MSAHVQEVMNIICRNTCGKGKYGVDHHAMHDEIVRWHNANPAPITPPKPEEPLGLGAVVEDAKGKRWVRGRDSNCHWYPETGFDRTVGPWAPWAEIAAVKVLSPGVTA